MKKQEWNEGLDHLDQELVKKYIVQKDELAGKRTNRLWVRFGAAAACLIVFVIAVAAVLMQKSVPVWKGPHYSAEEIAELFSGKRDAATTSYTKVYVPDAKYLYIDDLPENEYLGVYQYQEKGNQLNQRKFKKFVDGFLPELSGAIGVDVPEYEIKQTAPRSELEVTCRLGEYHMIAWQNETFFSSLQVALFGRDDGQIILDGEPVQIDQSLSDEEIIDSIQSIKNKLFDIFGVSFSDAKIDWDFNDSSEYADYIDIYFYNEDAHALNLTENRPVSDYIMIRLQNLVNRTGAPESENIFTKVSIRYYKNLDEYALIAKAKRISLAEAEELLYKGYVFGGHSCPICMSMQDEVDFEGYDFVNLEYVFGLDLETRRPTVGVPFYTFYKEIGTARNGNLVYAKTYVPAISVSGYEAYFERQKTKHPKKKEVAMTDAIRAEIALPLALSEEHWSSLEESEKSQYLEEASYYFAAAYAIPNDEMLEKCAILNAVADRRFHWVRPVEVLLGDIPENQPRLSVETAEQAAEKARRSGNPSKGSIAGSALDAIAGCADFMLRDGSTMINFYATDNSLTKFIVFDRERIAYMEVEEGGRRMVNCSLIADFSSESRSEEEALNDLVETCEEALFIY